MLGYDLQISTVTQRVIAGHCVQGNVFWVVQRTRNFILSCTVNHTVTQLYEALHHKTEGCGLDYRWRHWKFRWRTASRHNMTHSVTQHLTEINTRNISVWCEGVRFLDLEKFIRLFPDNFEIYETQIFVTLRGFPGMCRDCFSLTSPLPRTVNTSSSRNRIHGLS
jgi:hypothetical protein